MIKRLFLLGVAIVLNSSLFVVSSAAQVKIGYFSYDAVLRSMPEYVMAQEHISQLRAQYDSEILRSENEFNAKYEDFLDNLGSLATSIRRKRQAELQQQMEANIRFREEAKRLLAQAEDDIMEPVKKQLNTIVANVAKENGYIIVLNTDDNACPYIDAEWGDDITNLIKRQR